MMFANTCRLAALLLGAQLIAGCTYTSDGSQDQSRSLVVAWTTTAGTGRLGAMSTSAPWQFEGPTLTTGGNATLHCANGSLYVLSKTDGTVSRAHLATQQVQIIATVGPNELQDIAVVDSSTAFLTLRSATRLLRLNLTTGATTNSVNLSPFADDDGIPDLGMMAMHDGRLFVQVRRFNDSGDFGYKAPAYLAVIDIKSEQLIDTEPGIPGVQAIELLGTAPKHKMQVLSQTAELFVSASGAVHDEGGIEVINLTTLRSKGLIISEAFDAIGADLGPFVMVNPDEGFLVSSTDFAPSSHLQRFHRDDGVAPPPDLAQSIGYLAPAIVSNARRERLFFPSGQAGKTGITVIDVASGDKLTADVIPTGGQPSDLLLDCTS